MRKFSDLIKIPLAYARQNIKKITIFSLVSFLLFLGPSFWKENIGHMTDNFKIYRKATGKALRGDIGGAGSELIIPKSKSEDPGDCSNLKEKWEPDSNTRFEGNKVKLKDHASAGIVFLKENPKSLLNLRINFKSSMKTGINTNISFKNGNDEVKYAIGDGDFRTIRYYRSNDGGPTYILKNETRLNPEIDNQYGIEFTMGIAKQAQGNRMLGSLAYGKNFENTSDLEDIIIKNPERISLTLGLGLDGKKESESGRSDVYIELGSCNISG